MPTLVVAIVLCGIGAVVCYLVLRALGHEAFATQLSLAIFGLMPKVREALEKYQSTKRGGGRPAIETLGDYSVATGRAIIYASIVGFAAVMLSDLASRAISRLNGGDKESYLIVAVLFMLAWALPVLFLVGRWVGQRCVKHGPLIVLASAFLPTATSVINWINRPVGTDESLTTILSFAVIIFAVMIVGHYVGKHQRLPTYFSYLLKQLTPASQLAIVELAYAETLEKTRSFNPSFAPVPSAARPAASDGPHVLGVTGPYAGSYFPAQPELIFGRDPKRCNVVFPADLVAISGRHCALRFDPSACVFVLRDFESSNGTFVDGDKLSPDVPRKLKHGDEFYLHTRDYRFAVRSGGAA